MRLYQLSYNGLVSRFHSRYNHSRGCAGGFPIVPLSVCANLRSYHRFSPLTTRKPSCKFWRSRPWITDFMKQVICLNKPFQVLSQFTDSEGRSCLADFVHYKGYYPAGRLDYDSEGLILLTNDGLLQQRISHPRKKMAKTYWVQVEGIPTQEELEPLRSGIELKDGLCKRAKVRVIASPEVWPRNPPIRERKNLPTSWLEIILTEGKNRQVRRMTAAIGFPTLRLIRYAIGPWNIEKLTSGQWKLADIPDELLLETKQPKNHRAGKKVRSRSQRK